MGFLYHSFIYRCDFFFFFRIKRADQLISVELVFEDNGPAILWMRLDLPLQNSGCFAKTPDDQLLIATGYPRITILEFIEPRTGATLRQIDIAG